MKRLFIILLILLLILGYGQASELDAIWSYNADASIFKILVSDIDNDAKEELIIASLDKVYVLEDDGRLKWSSRINDIISITNSDLDNNGFEEVIVSSGLVSNIVRANIHIFDHNGGMRWKFPGTKVKSTTIMQDIKAIDLDENAYKEIVGGTLLGVAALSDGYDKFLWRTFLDRNVIEISQPSRSTLLANAFSDVYLLDLNGAIEWSYHVPGGAIDIAIADMYPDYGEEIFILSQDGEFHILGMDGELKSGGNFTKGAEALLLTNMDQDAYAEIITYSGNEIYALDTTLEMLWNQILEDSVKEVQMVDLDHDEVEEILILAGKKIYVIDKDGTLAREYNLGQKYEVNNLLVVDLNRDLEYEFIIDSAGIIYTLNINHTYIAKEQASLYYELAQTYLQAKDYENSSRYAEMAIDIYKGIESKEDILKTRLFILRIEQERKLGGELLADTNYQVAEEFYNRSDYLEAGKYLKNATQLYIKLKDVEGINRCRLLLMKIMDATKLETTSPLTTIQSTTIIEEKGKGEARMLILGMVLIISILIIFILVRKGKK